MLAAVFRAARRLIADAGRSYSRHGGRTLASAVAFSALLSVAPMLYIALGLASVVIGNELGRASVMQDLSRWIGADGANTIFALLERAASGPRSGIAHVLGLIVLVYASTRLFSQMKRALDQMWEISPKSGRGLRGKGTLQLRRRGLSLLLVVFVGVLIVCVVIVKTVLAASTHILDDTLGHVILRVGEMIISLVTTTLMFAALFKMLPDAKLAWRDAWRGALVTSVLFSIGATLIGLYLGHKALGVVYGPGGSIVLLLLWVHYSAQVFFFGAAVTGELARRRGRPIEPNENGVRILIHDPEDATRTAPPA
jgi:membrane protein